MSEFPFHAFIELIKVDQEVNALNAQIKKLQDAISKLRTQQETSRAHHGLIKDRAHDAKKAVDLLELEVKTVDQQEKAKKERLENATDHKQYQSLKNEIETLKHKQNNLEGQLLDAWHELETAQKEFGQSEQQFTLLQDTGHKEIEQKNSEIAQLQAQCDQLQQERAPQEKLVPAEWLEKYAVMRTRVSDPVVPVHQGSCSACFYKITEQDLIGLRHRKLLQCKSCYRFLYSSELHAEQPTQTIE